MAAGTRQASGDYHHKETPQWSRDGKWLLFSGNRNENWELDFKNTEVYRVSVETGETVALTDRHGPDDNPVLSPDGKKIAYRGYADRTQTYQVSALQVMNADGSGKREILTELDRSVSGLAWNGDSDGIYFQYDDHGDTKIGLVTLSGRFRVVADQLGGTRIGRPYGGGSFSVSPNGTIAYTHVTPYRPSEIAVVDRRRGEARIVTAYSSGLTKWRRLGTLEEIRSRSPGLHTTLQAGRAS